MLIDGILEASYPSSTTLLVLSIMPAAAMQLHQRIRCPILRRVIEGGITFFSVFMVAARLLSGVHWITDIAGSILLSAGLVTLYSSIATAPETNA